MEERFLQKSLDFIHPEPRKRCLPIVPVFIPFSGCRQRCLFCSQEAQTGTRQTPVRHVLDVDERALLERQEQGKPLAEAAFFGGTFTALPEDDLHFCLERAASWMRNGLVASLRCSTRPDALSPAILSRLKDVGFATVELGIQSFADAPLKTCARGYTAETAIEGCSMVRASGLRLGIQLMPGMPGMTMADAENDIAVTAGFRPEFVRLYPCLVLDGTGLEALWRRREYTPWELEPVIELLSRACWTFWNHDIPVIRMGLAEEPGLRDSILAGPRHPSLGNRARARALWLHICALIQNISEKYVASEQAFSLDAPHKYQGEFWGWRGELKPLYERIGLKAQSVFWHDGDTFRLRTL